MNHFPGKVIVVITGPTAVGKTSYAIGAAKRFSGEIVSADSMQIYKYMDIGSAKPTPMEMSEVRHYLVDEIDPREPFSVAEYQQRAKDVISSIHAKGKLPIISGGTGLYINSILYDLDFSRSEKRDDRRNQLMKEAELEGKDFIHNKLRKLNPDMAERIHPNNIKRVIRAIEVIETTGKNIPEFSQSYLPTKDYSFVLIGLNRDRPELYHRIDNRVDELIEMGLKKEVMTLLEMGLQEANISMKGIGYKEIIDHLKGRYDMDEAIRLIKRNTRHYAKRQITWFNKDPNIFWINISRYKSDEEAFSYMVEYLKENLRRNKD
ncbi:MAG: tRNA (adenosine(37)-N6)-dimethylallyltransferase MiaA [Anaerovoracaceae bacterium]|jgi:tRNA dimethylallyltransferase